MKLDMKTALALSVLFSTVLAQSAFANESIALRAPKARPSVLVLSKEQAQKKAGVTPKRTASILAVPVDELSTQPVVKQRVSIKPAVTRSVSPVVKKAPVTATSSVASAASQTAAETLNSCLAKEAAKTTSAIVCMNRELRAADYAVDSAEVRLFNCAEARKIEQGANSGAISELILSRRSQLRERAQAQFKSELDSAGQIGPRKTREIELRATLTHLDDLSKLNKKVCDSAAFSALLSK